MFPAPDHNCQNLYPFSDQNGSKTIPFGAAHTYIPYIGEYPPPPPPRGHKHVHVENSPSSTGVLISQEPLPYYVFLILEMYWHILSIKIAKESQSVVAYIQRNKLLHAYWVLPLWTQLTLIKPQRFYPTKLLLMVFFTELNITVHLEKYVEIQLTYRTIFSDSLPEAARTTKITHCWASLQS